MKNKILYIFLISILVGCSKNDDGPISESIPVDQRYLQKVTNSSGQVIEFHYTPDKRIEQIDISNGAIRLRYEYDANGHTTRVYFTLEQSTQITDFYYENDILVSLLKDDVEIPVEYFAGNNYYQFSLNDEIFEIYLNEVGDIAKIIQNPANPNEVNFFYEDSKLGSLHNGSPDALTTLVAVDFSVYFFLFSGTNLTQIPLDEFLSPNGNMTFENTYDDDNFLTASTQQIVEIDGDGNTQTQTQNFNYEYIQLE